MKNTTFMTLTVVLVAMIAFGIVGTVKGQEKGQNAAEEAYYREREAELLQETRIYLNELGYVNSGVTLNRIVDAEGEREYTFTIHHSRIDKMDAAGRKNLMEQLLSREACVMDTDNSVSCTIKYDFLIL